jgi:flagellar hook-length control protein FliK
VCFVIQPIVIGNISKNSTGKAAEKDEKTSSGFGDLLKLTVETEKGKDVNVEILGLLTQIWPNASMAQPSIMTSSPAQLTENIDNTPLLIATDLSETGRQTSLQQETLQILSEGEHTLQSNSKQVNSMEQNEFTSLVDLSQPDDYIKSLVEKLTNPVQTGLEHEIELKPKEQDSHSRVNVVTTESQTVEQPVINVSTNNAQQTFNSVSNPTIDTPVRATQFDQDLVKFVESAIRVQDMGDSVEAAFSLKPEHLGKVDVKVSIVDGNVTAEFLASTQSGKELLELNVQALRTALETQGFQVDKINISQQSATSLLGSFSQKGESNNGRHPQQDARKRNVQSVHNQEKEYRDFDLDSGSQINTTA